MSVPSKFREHVNEKVHHNSDSKSILNLITKIIASKCTYLNENQSQNCINTKHPFITFHIFSLTGIY